MKAPLSFSFISLLILLFTPVIVNAESQAYDYPIVDTGISQFYDSDSIVQKPSQGAAFYGQDAHYQTNRAAYRDNGNGTVTDRVTGLVWQQDMGQKMTFEQAFKQVKLLNAERFGGYRDWRVPSIKELYSLIQFTGRVQGQRAGEMFIDRHYFKQPLGSPREIDAQTWSSTEYVGRTMRNDETVFGVNFVDGRIKGYPKYNPRTRQAQVMFFRFVRGNPKYGLNQFTDNGDGTITDHATGLMWQQADSQLGMDWQDALAYAENLNLAGHRDWRLPNAKELQSIVDYSRSLQSTGSAAIDPIFSVTQTKGPDGYKQFPYFWTSTTHHDGRNPYSSAVYFAFGDALGQMRGRVMDVHGAGSQRSDPKTGSKKDYPQYFGPQGDVRSVFNYVRAVR